MPKESPYQAMVNGLVGHTFVFEVYGHTISLCGQVCPYTLEHP